MTHPASEPDIDAFQLAHCPGCGGWSYPPEAWGCAHCGAPASELVATPAPQAPRLLEFVTLHSALTTQLPVPCVIADVQLAPGLVEEAWIGTEAAEQLVLGMPLRAERAPLESGARWWFRPAEAQP